MQTEATTAGLTDADGDGVLDTLGNTPVDSDGDGVADYLDLDSDNDGIPDVIESQTTAGYVAPTGMDSDGDGTDDAFDPDSGGQFSVPVDTDGDGTADVLDTDSDNDGFDDITEHGLTLTGSDTNGDGIDDGVNASYSDPDGDVNDPATGLINVDTDSSNVDYRSFNDKDSDGVADNLDADLDGDGILNVDEGVTQDFTGQYNFTHNENNGNDTDGEFASNAPNSSLIIASSESAVLGSGLTELNNFGNPTSPGRQFEYDVRGVNSS